MRSLMTILLASLVLQGSSLRAQPPEGMVLVPAGEFVMGSSDGNFDEQPAHRVHVSAFYIDRNEVTNAEFARFVRESKSQDDIAGAWFRYSVEGALDRIAFYEERYETNFEQLSMPTEDDDPQQSQRRRRDAARWNAALTALRHTLAESKDFPGETGAGHLADLPRVKQLVSQQAMRPVRSVTWHDAQAYAKWAGKRLPTEAEWEKAARGTDERLYPWGNTWTAENCHTGLAPSQSAVYNPYDSDPRTVTEKDAQTGPAPVGSYPEGASPYGCLDMAGNVWEWTADWYGEYYYTKSQGAENPTGPEGLADGQLPRPYSEDELLRDPQQGRDNNTRKVLRGGGWSGHQDFAPFHVRCSKRLWSNPLYWHPDVGFRCVTEIERDIQ